MIRKTDVRKKNNSKTYFRLRIYVLLCRVRVRYYINEFLCYVPIKRLDWRLGFPGNCIHIMSGTDIFYSCFDSPFHKRQFESIIIML